MLFVRGIKGKLKLNPTVKIWGSLLLLINLLTGGLVHRFYKFREVVSACEARGGVWIGGAPRSSFCALDRKSEAER